MITPRQSAAVKVLVVCMVLAGSLVIQGCGEEDVVCVWEGGQSLAVSDIKADVAVLSFHIVNSGSPCNGEGWEHQYYVEADFDGYVSGDLRAEKVATTTGQQLTPQADGTIQWDDPGLSLVPHNNGTLSVLEKEALLYAISDGSSDLGDLIVPAGND